MLIAFGLAFTTPVQTWAVRRMLAEHPQLGLSVQRVSAGLGRVRLEGVRCERPGLTVVMPRVDAEVSAWRALTGRLEIEQLEAKGWTIDLRGGGGILGARAVREAMTGGGWPSLISSIYAAEPQPAPASEEAHTGIVSDIRLPIAMTVAGVDLEGTATLPTEGNGAPAHAKITVRGGGLAPGRDARFDVTVAGDLPKESPVRRIDGTGMISGRLESERGFSQVSVMFSAEAVSGKMAKPANLSLQANLIKSAGGESYRLELSSGGKTLVETHSQMGANSGTIAGAWILNLSDAALTPFAFGRALPRFSVSGRGKFVASTNGQGFEMEGALSGRADRLTRVAPQLGALGAIGFGGAFEVDRKGRSLRVTKLRVEIDQEESPVVEVEALQGFEFDAASAQIKVADPSKDVARVELEGLPLEWISPYLGNVELDGEGVRGELILAAHGGGFTLTSTKPIEIRRVDASLGGRELVRNLGVSARVAADYTPAGWQADVSDLRIQDASGQVAAARLRAGGLAESAGTVKVQGQWTLALPACFAQPGLAGYAAFKEGSLDGDLQGSFGTTKDLLLRVSTRGVVAAAPVRRELSDLALEVRGTIDASGAVTLRAPLTLDNLEFGTKSDLAVDASAKRDGKSYKATIKVAGGTLYADDLEGMLAPFMTGGAASSADPVGGSKAPVLLPWGNMRGTCAVILNRLVVRPDLTVGNLGVEFGFGPDGADVSRFKALVNGTCGISGDGKLSFDPSKAVPYTLDTELDVTGFDSAWVMGGETGASTAPIVGNFDFKGNLSGSGATPEAALKSSHGRLDILSKGGRFRLLRTDIGPLLVAKDSLGETVMSGLGAILGRGADRKGPEKLDESARMAKDLASALSDLKFDQMSMEADVDGGGEIRMRDFTLITPDVRLGGEGVIRSGKAVSFEDRTMDLGIQIALRGQLAEVARHTKLSDGRLDELGYSIIPHTFHIRGTLAHCDVSELRKMFAQMIAAQSGESLLDRIRGK